MLSRQYESILLILALLLLSGITTPSPENTNDPDHPFARHLASLYIKYLEAVKEGDVTSALDNMIAERAGGVTKKNFMFLQIV